ncbi:MAG TPA: alpha/beta hydrolase-fold protein, partial [Polyangiaceae bacterium]
MRCSGCCTAWATTTRPGRAFRASSATCRRLDLAVVMPNVHRSYYSNMARGYRYWDFITEELPNKARALFPLSARRELNFAAGLSMGGYVVLGSGPMANPTATLSTSLGDVEIEL